MKHFILYLLVDLGLKVQGQQITVTLGPDEIGQNQSWTITATVQNNRLSSYDHFPDIKGMKKRGTSTQSTTRIINGQTTSSQSVIMTYLPLAQGSITIPSFTMKINGETVKVTGKTVKVGPPVQQRDPFASFFDDDPADDMFGRKETEFVDVKEDAFLAMRTNKNEVYVGEGFNATLSFFVAESNRAPLQFHELSRQLGEILKRIKPANCWEENFNIENIEAQRVIIGGKPYDEYKIYQATFYPLNAEPIRFPSIGLQMIKYKVAKNPSFFGQNRLENFKTYYTKPKTITVKELPPHPLRESVAVGNYFLNEKLGASTVETGQSVSYEFNIYGEGNIAGIGKPAVSSSDDFEFYEPSIRQDINHANDRVTGTKFFNYFIIPKEPGTYPLKQFFSWVFFNPKTSRYDTLTSKLSLNVQGVSKRNEIIHARDGGGFYDKMGNVDNSLRKVDDNPFQVWILNGFVIVMAISSIVLLFRLPAQRTE